MERGERLDYHLVFQSAPLTGARGDGCCKQRPARPRGFQSAPLTGARGDIGNQPDCIRVPGSERRFNPLPSPERGETRIRSCRCQKRGETCRNSQAAVSIRSPHRSEGRRATSSGSEVGRTGLVVSIRSPHRSEGRPSPDFLRRKSQAEAVVFQSAPLTGARGDAKGVVLRQDLVSIRSPHRSEDWKRRRPLRPVSIRSPHRSEGRQAACSILRCSRNVSVSIRSPHRSEGRRRSE